jgi:hypothetical protein
VSSQSKIAIYFFWRNGRFIKGLGEFKGEIVVEVEEEVDI